MADVLDRDFDVAEYGFGARADPGINQRALTFERDEHVARKSVPFPMAGQPQHPAAKAPMTRTTRDDQPVEFVLAHFLPQCPIATVVLGLRELLPHGVAVIGRVAHIGEGQRLVELCSHDIPRLRADTGRADIHCESFSTLLTIMLCESASPSLVDRFDMGFFGELHRRGEIVPEELAELFHTYRLWLDAELGQFFLEGGNLQRLLSRIVQLRHDVAGCLCRRRYAVPEAEYGVRISGFGD